MSKTKSNKKFIMGSSIALLVLFGVSLGATYGITFATMDDPNYIKFHIADNEYDINDLQNYKSPSIKEGEDTSTEGDTSTSYSTDADIILTQYYSAALFGTTDYNDFAQTTTPINDYLLSGENDILTPYVWDEINDTRSTIVDPTVATEYKSYFVNMKFISESLNQPVFKYLANLNSDGSNQAITDILVEMSGMPDIDGEIYTSWNVLTVHSKEPDLYAKIIEALMDDTTYQKEIFEEMFIYSYLWQESLNRSYDYYITEAMTKAKMSIVSELTIDTDLAAATDIETLSGVELDNPAITAADWNTIVENLNTSDAISSDEYDSQISDSTFKGFKGIQFNTTDNTAIGSNYYDATNTWSLSSEYNVEGGIATTTQGLFTNEDVLTNANYYVADSRENINGTGAVISSEDAHGDITGTATVTSYSQLYPYLFAETVGSGSSAYLKNPHYTMFAKVDGDKITESVKGEAGNEYIFDRWFGEGESAGTKDSILGEIYIVESLISHDTSLKTKAYEYWNQRGYYIELSGKAKDNYSSYVPAGLLKKD